MFPEFVTTAQDGGKVVSLTHRPSLPPGNTPGTHFCQRLSRPQGHSEISYFMSMKIPLTLAGIEPATFRILIPVNVNVCVNVGHRDVDDSSQIVGVDVRASWGRWDSAGYTTVSSDLNRLTWFSFHRGSLCMQKERIGETRKFLRL